jgi:hypothetical protein
MEESGLGGGATTVKAAITYAIFRTFEEEWVWLVKQRA